MSSWALFDSLGDFNSWHGPVNTALGLTSHYSHPYEHPTDNRVIAPIDDRVDPAGLNVKTYAEVLQEGFFPESAESFTLVKNDAISNLWQAAKDWERQYIDGPAHSVVALGYSQSLPKAVAVKDWLDSLWTEYYTRKAVIQAATNVADIQNVSRDFSSFGELPHPFIEVKLEFDSNYTPA